MVVESCRVTDKIKEKIHKKEYIRSSCDVYNNFFGSGSFFRKSSGAAVGVGDVGDNIVGVGEHPGVSVVDGVAGVDGFEAFREYGVGVVFVFGWFSRHVGKDNGIVDVGIFLF